MLSGFSLTIMLVGKSHDHSVYPVSAANYFNFRWAVFSSHKILKLGPC